MPELCIHSADFVEAHLVNQLLEHHWIVGEQIHAPLPIVEADRARDAYFELSGIAAAHQRKFASCISARFNSSNDSRKCTNIRSPLCPSNENNADCPELLCSH